MKTTSLLTRLLIYTLIALILTAVPVRAVESVSLCVIYHLTGRTCPTCGMTRAFSNLFHLNFTRAYEFNPLITVFAPLSAFVYIDELLALIRRMRYSGRRGIVERMLRRLTRR